MPFDRYGRTDKARQGKRRNKSGKHRMEWHRTSIRMLTTQGSIASSSRRQVANTTSVLVIQPSPTIMESAHMNLQTRHRKAAIENRHLVLSRSRGKHRRGNEGSQEGLLASVRCQPANQALVQDTGGAPVIWPLYSRCQ